MAHLKGGCLCGEIRISVDENFRMGLACHCADCQRYNGGAPAYEAVFSREAFAVESGSPRVYETQADSGRKITRHFCGTCGTPLFADLEKLPKHVVVAVGALDTPNDFAIAAHIFTQSAPAWHQFTPGADLHPRDFPPPAAKPAA